MLFHREDFPMLCRRNSPLPLVYLDSAATTMKPHSVLEEMSHFYSNRYGTVHRVVYELGAASTAEYEKVREEVRQFLNGASPDEIIFTKGTTESINLVAFSWGEAFLSEGDEVLVSRMEHHSNIVPWQLLCDRKKAHLRVIPLKEKGCLDLEAYLSLLSPRVKMVAITHISNFLGIVNPLPYIIEQAHRVGAVVMVDGAQSISHISIDVKQLDCDFFAFSAHKIYGPTGVGILYGKKHLLNEMPPYQGGSHMIEKVSFESTSFQEPPLKFESGTPMIAEVIGLGAALRYVNSYGLENIGSYERILTQKGISLLKGVKEVIILGPIEEKCSLITFIAPGFHPLDIAALLDASGISIRSGHLCTQPLLAHFGLESVMRISLAPYNTEEELVYFTETLERILSLLKASSPLPCRSRT